MHKDNRTKFWFPSSSSYLRKNCVPSTNHYQPFVTTSLGVNSGRTKDVNPSLHILVTPQDNTPAKTTPDPGIFPVYQPLRENLLTARLPPIRPINQNKSLHHPPAHLNQIFHRYLFPPSPPSP